jgi:hypothetical protein
MTKLVKLPLKEAPIDEWVREFKAGKFTDAVLIYATDDDIFYRPLTDSEFNILGWMCLSACHSMLHEEAEEDEE